MPMTRSPSPVLPHCFLRDAVLHSCHKLPVPAVLAEHRVPAHVVSATPRGPGLVLFHCVSLCFIVFHCVCVSSLLTKYGIDMGAASGPALQCKRHIRRQVAKVYADRVANVAAEKSTLRTYLSHVHTSHVESMCFKAPRPFLCSGCPTRGIELLMRVRLRCLCVHARTSTYRGWRANPTTAWPACGAANETLSHFVLKCSATSEVRVGSEGRFVCRVEESATLR
jgi:hypothetical protein